MGISLVLDEGENMVKKVDVVGAVIYDAASKKFLVTMRDRKRMKGGLWEFPGGKIDKGESPEEALKREILEELNCEIKVAKLVEDYTYDYPELTVRFITYLCTIISGNPQLSEHEAMKWVIKEEIGTLNFPEADIPTVHRIIKGDIF
jgi:8-oxo-dGTP diphosphatase